MARKHIPVVVDKYLWMSEQAINDEGKEAVLVGSRDWYSWLTDEQHLSFSFRHHAGTITARHERQRNGWYWYAYCKRDGQIHKTYLGRPGELTIERLQHASTVLSTKATIHARKQRIPALRSNHAKNDLILTEKFSVPSTNTKIITRPQLLARLTAGAQSKLVILSTSAGYGKTTLLSDWYNTSRSHNSQWACAWISLDSYDDDALAFWVHVMTALNKVQAGIADEPLMLLHAAQSTTINCILKTFLNACQTLSTDITLILDNYHAIQTPTIHQELAFLLDHLPIRLHLVIASREDPPLPLARLRMERSLTELRNTDLRFSTEETAFLFETILQRHIAPDECIPLTEYTEGWIAGIQLASIHIQNPSMPADMLDSSQSKNRYILDYLTEEVLLKQSSAIQQFLLQTSMLDRMHSSLCDAVREQDDSQLQLEKLEHLNMFLIPLDSQGQWYRYHYLFAQTLHHHLQSTYPACIHDLQRRANRWYEEHDLLTPVTQHNNPITINRQQEPHRTAQIKHYDQSHERFFGWKNPIQMPLHIDRHIEIQTQQRSPQNALALLDPYPSTPKTYQPAHMAMPVFDPDTTLLEPLTKREHDVLQQLIQGASNRNIAQSLIISEGTVKKHVSNICSKLGVQSRTQAVAKSISLTLS